ncbi:hypothetical protein L6164_024479 [Bauhinia variegata]|uniref:Uncharacterized protein n=1 Tax=Bauhinia variegata TaxID=167791 RepID=A0ACB9LXC2_BAUVA|nr:hypothetical protein L6164_024479 [Bauhinia variegata]
MLRHQPPQSLERHVPDANSRFIISFTWQGFSMPFTWTVGFIEVYDQRLAVSVIISEFLLSSALPTQTARTSEAKRGREEPTSTRDPYYKDGTPTDKGVPDVNNERPISKSNYNDLPSSAAEDFRMTVVEGKLALFKHEIFCRLQV